MNLTDIFQGSLLINEKSYVIRYISASEIRQFFDDAELSSEDNIKYKIEQSEPCNVLILKGLDQYTIEDEIRNSICNITNKIVYDVRLIKDKASNTSRGFCFVEMGTVEDGQFLFHLLKNMSPPFCINGRKMIVGYARNNTMYSCNSRKNDSSVASNAIAAARSAQASLPAHLQDTQLNNLSSNTSYNVNTPGDPLKYVFDPYTGYYIDPNTGLYHDRHTGTYYNPYTQQFLYLDPASKVLIPFASTTVAAENTASKSEKFVSDKGMLFCVLYLLRIVGRKRRYII